MPQDAEILLTRHSIRGEGSAYAGLSPEGVEKAQKRAEELALLIEGAEPGSVVFLGGHSFEERTQGTLRAYSDALKVLLDRHPDILMFGKEQITEEAKTGHLAAARALQEKALQHPEAKVVIDLPLQMHDIGRKAWWYDEYGKANPAAEALVARHGNDYVAAAKEWFQSGGIIDGEQKMPNPRDVAESYLQGMRRLEDFVKQFSGDRKVKVVIVGHSFEIDSLLTYLANNGEVTPEGFKKIGDNIVDTTELAVIEPDSEGKIHLRYRGTDYTLSAVSAHE